MKKLWTFITLIALLLPLIVACGGDEEATDTPQAAAPVEQATEVPAEPKTEGYECTDPLGCVTVAAGEKLRLATALVISGPNETLGIDSQRGVTIAIADRGKVMGFDVEMVNEDGQCNAEGGQTAATKITSDETIVAVIGHNCSSSCTPAAPIYTQAGFTMISPSCTAVSLTVPETHEAGFVRTAHSDKAQGVPAAQFAYDVLGARTAATVHDGSPYAEQLQQVFVDAFIAMGGTITAQEAVNVGDTDMKPLLTSIAVDEPDIIYYPIFIAEGGFITVQAKDIEGLEDTYLMGADGMTSPDFVEAAGDAGEGMYFSGPDLTALDPVHYETFLAKHQEMYGEDPLSVFHAHAYDAANIIFDAIEAVGEIDADGNLHIGRQALRDAIYATKNFAGLTGNLNCDENGDCADPAILVSQIQNGEYVPIWSAKKGMLEAAPAEPTGPTLRIWADDTRAPVLEEVGKAFTEQYGVTIIVEEYGFGDIRDNLKIAGPAGEGPDIIIGAHDWLGELVINGLVAPMDLGDKADLFLAAAINGFTYNGELYGMPYATENVAFVRNPELVPDAPATWDEVAEIAAQLEADGTVEQGYIRQEGDPYHFFPIQTAFGGYVFGVNADGTYNAEDVGIDNAGSIAALQWMEMMVQEGHLSPGVDYDIMHAQFEAGAAAMMISGPWALPRIQESGIPYAVSVIPGQTQDAQPFLGVQGFMINAFSEDPLLAQVFLTEFIATEETMQKLFDADPRPAAFLAVREAIDDPDILAFAEAGANGLPMPAIPEMSAVWAAWGDAVTLVTQGTVTAEEAFTTAAEQIRTLIAEGQ
jgi:maltose-binding protein MalE/ABC-type branched-subunit amino acid transport system substrate-binding protein